MEKKLISLKDAYIIETLRNNSVSEQEIIERVEANDMAEWENLNKAIDIERLKQLRKEVHFRSVITNGYKVKFVTLKGLIQLLKLKFHKVEELDFERTPDGIVGLYITDSELAILQEMLSRNWVITSDRETVKGTFVVNIQAKHVSDTGATYA